LRITIIGVWVEGFYRVIRVVMIRDLCAKICRRKARAGPLL